MALSVRLATASPQEIGQLVRAGRVSPQAALEEGFSRGLLAAGTAESKPEYNPHRATSRVNGLWQPIAKAENGGALKVVRASRIARSIITCAVFGDCNETNQLARLGRPLVEGDDVTRFGWVPDDRSEDGFRTRVDGRLLAAVLRNPEAIVGAADFFEDDGSWRELNGPNAYTGINEPNHYISSSTQHRIGSIPISGAVFLAMSNIEVTTPIR